MKQLDSSGLKAILHSKRANIFVLEHCRVMQKNGRVLYLSEKSDEKLYYNIPIANTTALLLGNGTSITQAAVHMLSQAGVMIGFCGGEGTPLYMSSPVEWLSPQSEYRPTQYLQGWVGFWFNEKKRFEEAARLQEKRVGFIERQWDRNPFICLSGESKDAFARILGDYRASIREAADVPALLLTEARFTKELYGFLATCCGMEGFARRTQAEDSANSFLDQGNYLAYGLAASCLWVLGIPHGLALMHGKTRRGALVFDVADLVKDAVVMPAAFRCALQKMSDQEFRHELLQAFIDSGSMDFMFITLEEIALRNRALALGGEGNRA